MMRLCRIALLLASLIAGASAEEHVELHSVGKRSERGFPPRFVREEYQLVEGNTTFEDLVCLFAGGDVTFVSVFSAQGPSESCPRFPCPTATVGEDFVEVNIPEFFLKPGGVMCFDITLIDDMEIEGREFFLLALRDLTWGEIVDIATVTINDDDDPSLFRPSQFVLESAGTASVCVEGGIETVCLGMELLNTSTATTIPASPVDFILIDMGEGLAVDPGNMTCFQFMIVDDDLVEGLEEILFFVTPGRDCNATFSLGGVIKIVDNDVSPRLEFSSYSVSENDGSVEVCVTFGAPSSTTVTAHVETQPGTAVDTFDFLSYESDFAISGGERSCHSIQLVNNSNPELFEHFKVLVTSSNSVAEPGETVIRISDDDVLDFEGSTRRFFLTEADNLLFPICVSLVSGSTNSSVMGFIYTESGSAKVNTDFRAIRRRFLFNHTDEMCFILVILQDIFPELQEEMTIGLLTISNGFIFSSVKATLTIRDDDSIPCEDLDPPTNGRITFLSDGNNPGSVAVYACDGTFSLVGSERRVCQVDGIWTGTEPTCEPEAVGLGKNI